MRIVLREIRWDYVPYRLIDTRCDPAILSWCWIVYSEKRVFFYLNKKGKLIKESADWYTKTRKEMEKIIFFKTREEAEEYLKKWFDTQPPEVFAEYIAQRMGVTNEE